MICLGQIGGQTAGNRLFCAKLCKADAAKNAYYAANQPAYKSHAHGHVGTLKYVAAKIVNTGAYGHACHKAYAGEEAKLLFKLTVKLLAIAIIVIFTLLNLRGVKFGAAFQNFSMVVRVIPLILVIFVGLFFGTQQPDLNPATAFQGEKAGIGDAIKLIAFATFASLWAYEGWTNLNTVAGEMKKPRRDIPLAIIISMGFITLVYTLFNLAIYRIIPANEVNSMIAGGNLYLGTEAVGRILGGVGKWVVLIGMFIGIIGTVNGDCLVFPRTYYAMAKGGYFQGNSSFVGTSIFAWPFENDQYISSRFGTRVDPFTGEVRTHGGTDIAAPMGTPILASADGTVVAATWHNSYGYYVKIKHNDTYSTLYAHCSALHVSVGQTVSQGQIIADCGSTGNSTGPHCHFEVIQNGVRVDALMFFN